MNIIIIYLYFLPLYVSYLKVRTILYIYIYIYILSLRYTKRILSIIHKSIYSFTPSYISDLINKRTVIPSLH